MGEESQGGTGGTDRAVHRSILKYLRTQGRDEMPSEAVADVVVAIALGPDRSDKRAILHAAEWLGQRLPELAAIPSGESDNRPVNVNIVLAGTEPRTALQADRLPFHLSDGNGDGA